MKKTLLLLAAALMPLSAAFAQLKDNVARECVLFELFTGIGCQYCPAAANGVAQLLAEGKAIAPVAYHTSAFSPATYYTVETNARANFYGVNSYPTLKADGILSYSGGGSASQSNYATYLSRYNQRINQPSPFTIDLTCEPGANGIWNIHCVVNQVGECTATNLRVMMALTQCNIDVTWQGMTGLHHVCRDLIPTQAGTVFTGPSMTIDETFEMRWPKQDCYLTAWVQDFSSKEVFQAVRLPLALDLDYDLVAEAVDHYSATNCSGMISPKIFVSSYGNEEVTSFDAVALADGEEVFRETWNGLLHQGEKVDFQLSEFNMGDCSDLKIMVVNPNGQEDGYDGDNTLTVGLTEPLVIDGYLKMQARTDGAPEDITVQIMDMSTGEVLYEFHFDIPSHVYQEEMNVLNAGCYCIRIMDAAGDGLSTGLIRFIDANNRELFKVSSTSGFADVVTYEFSCDGTVSVEEGMASLSLFPNPSDGRFFLDLGEGSWQVEVYDVTGRVVFHACQFDRGTIDLNDCGSGVFFLKASDGEREVTKKILVY
ncbi:MAG: T9SS type A sorting domain-containing protein [Bacteroidales bacterium]|nr:T9SS type A sorting domain-containing protein [Bacteroidales bacterium]